MPELKVRIGCVVLAVIMSAVTYYFVEPRLRWGRYGGYKAAGLLSVMVIIGVAGYAIERHDGYTVRVPMDADEKKIAQQVDSVWKSGQERYRRAFPELFDDTHNLSHNGFLEKDEGRNNIALFGDSHAWALLPGLLVNEGENDGIAGFIGYCAIPFIGIQAGNNEVGQRKFVKHRNNYKAIKTGFDYVLSRPEIEKVILANFPGCFQFWGIRSLDNPLLSFPKDILEDGISRTFKALSDAGKEVVYVLDVPTFSKNGLDKSKSNACAAKADSLHTPALPLRSKLYLSNYKVGLNAVCAMPDRDNGTADGRALLKQIVEKEAGKFKNIHVVDLMQTFCQKGICNMTKNGQMLYSDSQHINRRGAVLAAPLILRAFEDDM